MANISAALPMSRSAYAEEFYQKQLQAEREGHKPTAIIGGGASIESGGRGGGGRFQKMRSATDKAEDDRKITWENFPVEEVPYDTKDRDSELLQATKHAKSGFTDKKRTGRKQRGH